MRANAARQRGECTRCGHVVLVRNGFPVVHGPKRDRCKGSMRRARNVRARAEEPAPGVCARCGGPSLADRYPDTNLCAVCSTAHVRGGKDASADA